MQNTFGICVQRMFWVTEFTMLNTVKRVLLWQLNFEKNCTDCKLTEKYKNLRFITVTLIMLSKKLLSLKHSVRAT